ncbi:TPA: plasmid mobilization relaxosome protein MobC [Pseudomonas aeruginosa]
MARKNIQLNVRVSKEAKQLIADNAKLLDMKQGEYIETIARKGLNKVVEINNPKLQDKYETIINALDKLGNNINQIAKKVNSGDSLGNSDAEQIEKLTRLFDKVYNTMNKETDRKIIFNNQEE